MHSRFKRLPIFILLPVALLLMIGYSGCRQAADTGDDTPLAHDLIDRASYLMRLDHRNDPFRFLDSAYATYPQMSRRSLIQKHLCKSHLYDELQNYPMALIQADSAINMLADAEKKYKEDYAEAVITKGQTLVKLRDYNRAFQYLYDSKLFIEKEMDTCTYARYSSAIASVLYMQRKYKEAIKYMWDVYERSGKCNEADFNPAFVERQGSLDNIGLCYENSGQYDSAIIMYNKALDFIDQHAYKYPSDTMAIANCRSVVYGNMGSAYLKMDSLAAAEKYLRLNLNYNSGLAFEPLDGQYALMKLARVFLAEKRLDTAYAIITHIRQKLADKYYVDEDILCRKLTWNYYEAKHDIPAAYSAYLSYKSLSDSIDVANRELPGVDFNRAFYQLKQDTQIAALRKENRFKNFYLAAFVLLSAMAGIIVFLVYRNYRLYKVNLERQTLHNEQMARRNKALEQTLEALEISQQENNRMMRVVAHDLHNPIAAMVSLADILNDAAYDEEHNQMVEMMAKSGRDTLKLINNLLNTQPTLEKKEVQLDEVIADSIALLQFRANEKQQEIVLHKEPVKVLGDKEKLWRVINNLVVNAIKFSHKGAYIYISLERKDGKALITVKDEGIGITAAEQENLFDRHAEGRTGTAGEASFGLGLSISKQIVEAHGGRIWVASQPGKGTTFFVELEALTTA